MSPNRPRRPRRKPFLLSLLMLLIAATALVATAAQAASAPTTPRLESAVGRSAPLASAHVRPNPLQSLNTPQAIGFVYDRIAVATGVAAKPGASFIAGENGVVVSTSRARLEESLSGLPSRPTTGAAGREYTLPDGSLVRIMEPSGQAPLRASFTNSKGGPINPFTGKPVQAPAGLTKAERLKYVRDRTHVELGP